MNRTQKQSPSASYISGSVKGLHLKGPTSNLRNLAGQLLMSGSMKAIHTGGSLNDMLLKKNQDLQQSVKEQMMIHQHLEAKNKQLSKDERDGQQITGYQIDTIAQQK